MSKIQFDIKYRPEIESGKYKVIVGSHKARIVCWDLNGDDLIVCVDYKGGEQGLIYDKYGKRKAIFECLKNEDLEILTDEVPELTEFEKAVQEALAIEIHASDEDAIRELSKKLLYAASVELRKERIVLGFEEMRGELEKRYAAGVENGRRIAEANIPTWRTANAGKVLPSDSVIIYDGDPDPRFGKVAVKDGMFLPFVELINKLPMEGVSK